MARKARPLSTAFWADDKVAHLSRDARLTLVGQVFIHLQTLPAAATSVTRARPAIPTMDGLASSAVSRG